jgi:hypothetical protein
MLAKINLLAISFLCAITDAAVEFDDAILGRIFNPDGDAILIVVRLQRRFDDLRVENRHAFDVRFEMNTIIYLTTQTRFAILLLPMGTIPKTNRQEKQMRDERKYTVEMEDEGGASETAEISVPAGEENEQDAEANRQAVQLTTDWISDGDWGNEGASVDAWYTLSDEDYTFPREHVTVEIEANEKILMREAGANPDCRHEFTSDGEGGCKENPGVWSLGGTKFSFRSHCKHCGLIRHAISVGTQRNPGEHDTVTFELPDEEWVPEED